MTMVGHLVDFNVHLGRSLIVDLEAPIYNRYRQVDHRTIQYIILRNVKYKLASKSNLEEFQKRQEDKPKPKEKWDLKKLQEGNWFSEMQYYKYLKPTATETEYCDCQIINNRREIYEIPYIQMKTLMYHGSLYDQEKKVTRTEMIEIFTNAKECVFTVTFRKKVDPKDVMDEFNKIKSEKELQMNCKKLAATMVDGQKVTITGILSKAEKKLGRSSMYDLTVKWGWGHRQVDHRTLEELIIKNVKYSLKK